MAADVCKATSCPGPVVGSSITGEGKVCAAHNTEEWGRALAVNLDPYYRKLGRQLLTDAKHARVSGTEARRQLTLAVPLT